MNPTETRKLVAPEAIEDALAGCALTGGTLCAHIAPEATHFGSPGRILQDGETCPLLPIPDRQAMASTIFSEMKDLSGPSIVAAHAVATSARKSFAETTLAGTLHHPDRYAERAGRYDGSL